MLMADVTTMLARTPGTLRTLLAGLPEDWPHRDDGPGTWSAYAIVGHLLHAEATNWLPRTRIILAYGTGQPLNAFDREAMLSWETEPVPVLLDRWQKARDASLVELSSLALSAEDLERRGKHEAIGEVTIGQILAAWVAHDLTHIAQVAEVLARRHRDDVGPFREFMPGLDRVAEAE